MKAYNPRYRGNSFTFTYTEIQELLIAWGAISLAFTFLLSKGSPFNFRTDMFVISLITVGVGFLLHELAHKFVAQYYRCKAEFQSDNRMLILALVLAFFTPLVFAAPGAVVIHGVRNKRHLGHIAVAGPITNIVLAVVFAFVPGAIGDYGFMINAWLALFNMIPFGPLDGAKILAWNKQVFYTVGLIALVMVFVF